MFLSSQLKILLFLGLFPGAVLAQEVPGLQIDEIPELELDQETTMLGRTLLAALVWIPYLLISKRVKATFRR